jgi:hypothetical protein
MSNIAVLDKSIHHNVRVDRRPAAKFGGNQRFVQVVLREFPLLAPQYPILLSKNSDTGAFFCGAMLGFDDGENLFLTNDNNHEGYRPLNLQREPFYYVEKDRLALDFDSPRVNDSHGEALYGPDGEPTNYLRSILFLFHELRPGLKQTHVFIDALLKHNLLAPVEFELDFDSGDHITLQDLYTIRESSLREISDEAAIDFFRNGYLYAIHLMIASLNQIARLAERKNRLMAGDTPSFIG